MKPSELLLAKIFVAGDVFIEQSLELEDELYLLAARATNKSAARRSRSTLLEPALLRRWTQREAFAAPPEELRLAKRQFANLVRPVLLRPGHSSQTIDGIVANLVSIMNDWNG